MRSEHASDSRSKAFDDNVIVLVNTGRSMGFWWYFFFGHFHRGWTRNFRGAFQTVGPNNWKPFDRPRKSFSKTSEGRRLIQYALLRFCSFLISDLNWKTNVVVIHAEMGSDDQWIGKVGRHFVNNSPNWSKICLFQFECIGPLVTYKQLLLGMERVTCNEIVHTEMIWLI